MDDEVRPLAESPAVSDDDARHGALPGKLLGWAIVVGSGLLVASLPVPSGIAGFAWWKLLRWW